MRRQRVKQATRLACAIGLSALAVAPFRGAHAAPVAAATALTF